MNLYRQTLLLLLVAAFLTGECAYAREKNPVMQYGDAPSTQMTVNEAQAAMVELLSHALYSHMSARNVNFTQYRASFIYIVIKESRRSISFAKVKNLLLVNYKHYTTVRSEGQWEFDFVKKQDAMMFADAVLTLKEAALKALKAAEPENDTEFAAFTANAKTWLAATSKPEMSDEARTYKVLAEDAFERKDFTAALDAFCKALDKYPMWRKGQYNAAILAAEAEDYELAAYHMRRYLVLAPDAKDAAAAKDKLLLWQFKAKE